MSYTSYDNDKLEAAQTMKIERRIYFETKNTEITPLTALTVEQLQTMREESATAEQAIYGSLREQAAAWEKQAGQTLLLDKAIEYARTPPVKHTANQWQVGEYGHHSISNAVYEMRYHVYERTRYDKATEKSIPYAWDLSWSIRTNSPDGYRHAKIAGQDKKVFGAKNDMEKYLNGRMKAYAHLFTEISPPIPQEYAGNFRVNGQLLPGYTVEGEQPLKAPDIPTNSVSDTVIPPTQEPPETATTTQTTTTTEPEQPRPVIPLVLTSEKPGEKLKEITDRLEQGITELFKSDQYRQFLSVMSKFHNYSFNNTLLIAMQKPDASLIAGFNSWKNEFDRNVKKGEKGIKIIAPSPYKVKKEMEKIDPQTQRPVMGKDGKPVTEEREVTIPAFKVVSVFDVSQTEGKELPDIAVDALTGDVEQYKDFFAALEKTAPVPIGFEKMDGGTHGYYHLEDKRIAIAEGMSELQTLKTTIHEIAHAKLHDIDLKAPITEQQNRPDRRTREVEAESIAYTVCQHYGLDTSDYSFGYVAGWSSGRELAELKSSLETIRTAAAELIDSIDGHIAQIQKEQTAAQEQPGIEKWSEPATAENTPENPGAPSDDVSTYLPEQEQATFSIYQLKSGDETRDFRFEPYDRLQAAGLTLDAANYELTYTATLESGMRLEGIFEKFNLDRPADFTGHSLSVSDVVVLHRSGQDTAHYVDSGEFRNVPEFLKAAPALAAEQQAPTSEPDSFLTGETVQTPRGSFRLTAMSKQEMEATGYGFHHQSDDGKYFIMGNGTRAFAIQNEAFQEQTATAPTQENPLATAELSTEQNYNMIDGVINNTPTVGELEAKVNAGEQISLTDLAAAIKADKQRSDTPKEKPSIRAQLKESKEKAATKKATKTKNQDLEV